MTLEQLDAACESEPLETKTLEIVLGWLGSQTKDSFLLSYRTALSKKNRHSTQILEHIPLNSLNTRETVHGKYVFSTKHAYPTLNNQL
jgi:hypothetical protein